MGTQAELRKFLMGDETNAINIRCLDADEHGPVELAFIAGKGLQKILDGGINDLYAGRAIQDVIEHLHQPGDDEC